MSKITEKELKLLFPTKDVEIAGHTFTLKPFTFHQTFIVADKLKNVLGNLRSGMTTEDVASIVIGARDGVEEILSMALDLDVEVIQQFDNQSAMKAIVATIEVNLDFFVNCVQGELTALNRMMSDEPQTQTTTKKSSRMAKQ